MDVPATCYYGANGVQRRDASEIIAKYSNQIQWRSNGEDSILDIGSGTGDVTCDFILPILPTGFKKMIGVDIAEDMIKQANRTFGSSRVSFEKWDMGSDVDQLLRRHPEGFDHIFSFFALHWCEDQRRVVQNIYDLLNPDGDCLLVFLGKHDLLDVVTAVATMPKWSKIIKNPNPIGMPYRHQEDRVHIFRDLLKLTGFKKYSVEGSVRTFTYNNLEEIKKNVTAVNSNVKLLTPTQREEYFCDYIDKIFEMGMGKSIDNGNDCQYTTTYTLMIAYAQK